MSRSWKVREVDATMVGRLVGSLGVHPVTARCLAGRGIDCPDLARGYLEPRLAGLRRPVGLSGLEAAVERMGHAIAKGERIGVFGDYDVDGVTTAALMTTFLRDAGAPTTVRVARRDAGYGFGLADVAHFAEAGCSLVITGDCGTSDVEAIHAAAERGIDVVVVDHHTVPAQEPGVPHPAHALINPFRADSTFPFRGMASVGLAFYVMAALRTRLREAGHFRGRAEPDVRELLDLVALGTIADLVPLQGENRILTSTGLRYLQTRRRPGLAALLSVVGVAQDAVLDERTISWKLAPRLNAPGRLGDAGPALELLLADERSAMACAERLEQANEQRRVEQQRVLDEVTHALGDGDPGPAVVVSGAGWASGVAGIVAAKLVDRYRRPAFVIAVDPATGEGRGSARSAGGVDLYQALARCSDRLVRFGGHAGAAGLTVRAEHIDEVRARLCEAVASAAADAHALEDIADAEVTLGEIDERLTRELGTLAPFGKGNDEPLLISRGLRVQQSRRVGADGAHLKLHVADHSGALRPAIAFGLGDRDPGVGARIDAAFAPSENVWQGRRSIELSVRHFDVSA